MTQRLQVLFDEEELQEIRALAARERMTVAEWVRQALRAARKQAAVAEPMRKVASIHEAAARYSFPADDIAAMNAEISRGYRGIADAQS